MRPIRPRHRARHPALPALLLAWVPWISACGGDDPVDPTGPEPRPAVATLRITVPPEGGIPGLPLLPPVTVEALDASARPLEGVLVSLRGHDAAASEALSGETPRRTNGYGVATFRELVVHRSVEGLRLVASAEGVEAESAPITVQGRAWIKHEGGGVSEVGRRTGAVLARFSGGGGYGAVDIAPDGRTAYVVGTPGELLAFDTRTRIPVARVALSGDFPQDVRVAPDGSRVYVTNSGDSTLAVVETGGHTVVAELPLPGSPRGVAVAPDRSRVYVALAFPRSQLAAIDAATLEILGFAELGAPIGLDLSPDGRLAYAADAGTVRVVDTRTLSEAARIVVAPGRPRGPALVDVVVSPDGSRAYAAAQASDAVYVIETAGHTVVAEVPVGDLPYALAITGDGTRLYVANRNGASVSVVDTEEDRVVATIPVPTLPGGIALTPP